MRPLWILICFTALFAVPLSAEVAPEDGEPHHEIGALKQDLGLTDDQQTKLKSMREAQKTAMKSLLDARQAIMKKLESQVHAKASDNEIQSTLGELKANRMAMKSTMEQFENQREGLLTPTQRAKMMLKMNSPEGREKMHKRMKPHSQGGAH